MYSRFFNLIENPFSETPDTRFYFNSVCHLKASACLRETLDQGQGFAMLTGEVGMGKTIFSRHLLNQLKDHYKTALLLFPNLQGIDLISSIGEEFGLTFKPDENAKKILDQVTDFLIYVRKQGKTSVLVIDEAQALSLESLETIRFLSNIEQESEKLLQIILIGQPELAEKLSSFDARPINQRISSRFKLNGLLLEEVFSYIEHRIEIAGGSNFVRFDNSTIELIHKLSQGIPRLINTQCRISLKYAEGKKLRIIKSHDLRNSLLEANALELYRIFPFGREEKLVQL